MSTLRSSPGSTRLRRGVLALTAVLLAAVVALTGAPEGAQAAIPRPTNLQVTSFSGSSATVSWTPVRRAVRYRVKYSTSAEFAAPMYGELATAGTRLNNLAPGTAYYVKVRVVSATGAELSPYSRPVRVIMARFVAAPMQVGSYNVRCYNCDANLPNEGSWVQRRTAVVQAILSQDLDVVGLQEASPSAVRTSAGKVLDYSQFQDLTKRLGPDWKVTSNSRYNCVRSTTPSRCRYQDRGASKGNKILYNSSRIQVLDSGSELLPSPEDSLRWAAWARLRQRSTGLEFMFSTTHLEARPALFDVRVRQAEAALGMIQAHNPGGSLPMVAVGDLNSNRWSKPSNAPYDIYLGAGFVDPLGGAYGSTTDAPGSTVERRINTWLSSANGFERRARGSIDRLNGTYIDYIFTTPMRVSEWETVARLDGHGNFVGRIPSDHNLIRATVWLPAV